MSILGSKYVLIIPNYSNHNNNDISFESQKVYKIEYLCK